MSSPNATKSFMEKAKGAAVAAAQSAKAAAQVAAKQAERVKITQVSLPNAYLALGKDIYHAGRFRDEFGDLFTKLDGILTKVHALKEAPPPPAGQPQSLADKAKAAAGHAKDLAKGKALEVEANGVLRQLGEAAYEKHGGDSGPQQFVAPIVKAFSDLAAIDTDINRLSGGKDARLRYNPFVIGASLLFCFPAGLYFVWTHPNWISKTKWIWTGAWAAIMVLGMIGASREPEKEAVPLSSSTTPDSEAGDDIARSIMVPDFREGYDRGVQFVTGRLAYLDRIPSSSTRARGEFMEQLHDALQKAERERDQLIATHGATHPVARQKGGYALGIRDALAKRGITF